ncbi:hypothetical protein SCOR_27385 [Sulfidibacter corallicola]
MLESCPSSIAFCEHLRQTLVFGVEVEEIPSIEHSVGPTIGCTIQRIDECDSDLQDGVFRDTTLFGVWLFPHQPIQVCKDIVQGCLRMRQD